MIKVEKYYCRSSLRTGAISLGVIILILGIFSVSLAAYGLSEEENLDAATLIMFDITDTDVKTAGKSKVMPWFQGIRAEVTKNQVSAYLVVQLILGILGILTALSLLFGIFQFKPTLLVPILIIIPVDFAVLWVTLLAIAGVNIFIIVTMVAMTLLWTYHWVCLFSFWHQQKEHVKPEIV